MTQQPDQQKANGRWYKSAAVGAMVSAGVSVFATLFAQGTAEGLIHGLSQLGPVGLLAAVLFYLHVHSLKVFRTELEKEREFRWQMHRDNVANHELNMRRHGETLHELHNIYAGLRGRISALNCAKREEEDGA